MTSALIWRRLLTTGGLVAVLVFLLGGAGELVLIGRTDAVARARAEREIQAHVDGVDASLTSVARRLAGRPDVLAGITGDLEEALLFEAVRLEAEAQSVPDLSITIYDARGIPRGWSGRPAEHGRDRVQAGPSGFAETDQAGLRLVHVEPIVDPGEAVSGGTVRHLGSVVSERVLSPAALDVEPDRRFGLKTAVGRATVRAVDAGTRISTDPERLTVIGSDGRPLIEAVIGLEEIARTRARWRARVLALVLVVLAVTTLSAGGLALPRRARTNHIRTFALLALVALAGRAWLWLASTPGLFGWSLLSSEAYRSVRWPWLTRTPVDLLLTAMLVAVLVVLLADTINRKRWTTRADRGGGPPGPIGVVIWQVGAITLVAMLLAGQHLVLRDTVAGTTVDLLHTALQPFDTARVSLLLALVLTSAATVWAVGLVFGASFARWPVGLRQRAVWLAVPFGMVLAVLAIVARWVPLWPSLLTTALGLLLALRWRRTVTWFRHADPLARVLATLCAILLPALPLYVALVELTDDAKRQLLESSYAVQVAEHPKDLREQLTRAQEQIDQLPDLREMTVAAGGLVDGSLDTDRAFKIWQQTALAESRLTSSVELYGADGALNSRFALNIPEDAVTASGWAGTGCAWDVFGLAVPFGAEERRMLHAERGLCGVGPAGASSPAGAVVVVAQVDYESLPFISSPNPYVELVEGGAAPPLPGAPGHDVELVIYGWGLQPTFVSNRTAWTIDEALFQRIYAWPRTPFWTRLAKDSTFYKDSRLYDVLITNDRAGIYALGYPIHTPLDHVLHLSEIAILAIAAFALVLVVVIVSSLVFPGLRRRLAFRARFALKLQLWFLGVATAPVLVVAGLIQWSFADQLRADVEAGAARSAAIAQSVLVASAPRAVDGQVSTPFTDDALVQISQVIGQDVNIFDGPQLVATSERDLYASGLLPTRTPDMVYRAIALERRPSFVGQDAIGSLPYQLAAVPVRAGGGVILTVPLASRQQEIESQIDELNRLVSGSALFFAAVVGFIGWAIARRIADPVRRLTSATSRVARGEFHAPMSARRAEVLEERVADKSADELEILESDFNRMAVELDAQRRQLERTHRLEAWSEMARQVAHEIKNPLTPVQLSAEHLLRVHADRGSPLSPVLQGCVDSILKQVRILRQIASEFSSYASSPVADRVPTQLDVLIEKIVGPYRPGLEGRIDISVDLPTDLPVLSLDRRLMQRALTNLVENALHAMPDGGALSLSVIRHPATVEVVATDTGVGVEPDVLARIFEPYFSTRVTGTGLGMAIVKRNIELHDGTIAVTSEPGQGTTVTITLPCTAPTGGTERV